MIYASETTEKNAAMRCAELMSAAARTAPKACGVDLIRTAVVDGGDKDRLTAAMREIGKDDDRPLFIRDAGNVDACHCAVLIGTGVKARGLNCGLCGASDCKTAENGGIACALSVNDLGIAVGSAASVAMDNRMDNRVLFTAGMAALRLKLLPGDVNICFGIGLATTGKNIFFDRPTT
ncbi:MAG: DUF2148 domain-containing protein [Oscillospiraceae bacterium]|jgi:uncharacterized ferredoxin-like protein|nr:DUF2148 domain-containing protein [Oscillospiraceae bacterium]